MGDLKTAHPLGHLISTGLVENQIRGNLNLFWRQILGRLICGLEATRTHIPMTRGVGGLTLKRSGVGARLSTVRR